MPEGRAVEVLACGEVEVVGRMPWSSNLTFLATCALGADAVYAVYKPGRGERPLWDFPRGLYRREVAAWVVSERLGWNLVPETVLRGDGPLGEGSLQRFVEADFEQHYFTIVEDERHHDDLRRLAALDIVVNNTDRKSGHVLLGLDGRPYAIDNGLCFHRSPKLRTVIWEFAGERLAGDVVEGVAALADDPPVSLGGLLDDDEVEALRRRARALARSGRLPAPHPEDRPYPWPLV